VLLTGKIKIAFSFLFLITVAGTAGYHFLEGWSLANSFYATIVTLGTVGFGDFYPVTPAGKSFAIFHYSFWRGNYGLYIRDDNGNLYGRAFEEDFGER